MKSQRKTRRVEPAIFSRLRRRGIDWKEYSTIKKILFFEVPQSLLFFERNFPGRSASSVIRKINGWNKFIENDFVLFPHQMKALEAALDGAKLLAWGALADSYFVGLGDWNLTREFVQLKHPRPGCASFATRIVAQHQVTGETRDTLLLGARASGRTSTSTWEKAFTDLGIVKDVLREPHPPHLMSAERPQAWPIFTQFIIPRLYEFLLPHYPARAHVAQEESVFTRNARYPRPLLEDIRAILRLECPDEFRDVTTAQLKSLIQRHLKRKSTKTQKNA